MSTPLPDNGATEALTRLADDAILAQHDPALLVAAITRAYGRIRVWGYSECAIPCHGPLCHCCGCLTQRRGQW